VDELLISLSAKGLTTGEVAAHLAKVYGAEVSRQTISTITDKVIEGRADWQNRPLDPGYRFQPSTPSQRRHHPPSHVGPQRPVEPRATAACSPEFRPVGARPQGQAGGLPTSPCPRRDAGRTDSNTSYLAKKGQIAIGHQGHGRAGLNFAFDCAGLPPVREQGPAPSITEHLPPADAAEAVHRLEHKISDPFRLILVPPRETGAAR
jgi:Transposase, Mutator family